MKTMTKRTTLPRSRGRDNDAGKPRPGKARPKRSPWSVLAEEALSLPPRPIVRFHD